MRPSHEPPPTSNGLKWCHACGDWVEELHGDNTCILCLEIDVRADAFIAAAMEDFAERSIGVALDYLHVDDVSVVIDRLLEDPLRANDAIPRLRHRYRLAHEFIERRTPDRRSQVGVTAEPLHADDEQSEPANARPDCPHGPAGIG